MLEIVQYNFICFTMQSISLILSINNTQYSAVKKATILFAISSGFLLNSQTLINKPDGYIWFDSIVSAKNTNLYNGIIEIEKFRMEKDKHKFYLSPKFQLGTLFYEGQPYYSVEIKYDLYEDVVLINGGNTIRLENSKIDRFFIGNKAFVKLKPNKKLNIDGFFELLINTPDFKFYKKHKKTKLDRLGDKLIYHDFKADNRYYIHYQNDYHIINAKKDIINVFPMYKEQLKRHDKKSLGKRTTEDFLLFLLDRVNKLLLTDKISQSK